MSTHDTFGRAYLRLADCKDGMKIICDGGFDCMDEFETARICRHPGQDQFFFFCANGLHSLSGTVNEDGCCVGVYPAGGNIQ